MPVPQAMIDDLAGVGGKPEPDEEAETNEDGQEDANEESVIKDLIVEL